MNPQKVRLVVNGKAARDTNKEELYQRLLLAVAEELKQAVIQIVETHHGGEAAELAADAARAGYDIVAAVGGDGTLNEVVNGVLGAVVDVPHTAVGVIPMGTANDFARSCDVDVDDPAATLRQILREGPRLVDVGKVRDRYFLNVATGGVGTQATAEASAEMKSQWGPFAYAANGLRQLLARPVHRASFEAPGFDWSGEYLVLAIGNGRQAGGGWALCPAAVLDDGLFDLLIIPADAGIGTMLDATLAEPGRVLEELFVNSDEHKTLLEVLLHAYRDLVITRRVPWVKIHSAEPTQLNLDGEPLKGHTFDVQLQARRLRLALPSHSPLAAAAADACSG